MQRPEPGAAAAQVGHGGDEVLQVLGAIRDERGTSLTMNVLETEILGSSATWA
jgi:hypothetical protein